MEKERSTEEIRFAEIIGKAKAEGFLSDLERAQLDKVALAIGAKSELIASLGNEKQQRCYWICQNNSACNPESPPPNCRCRRICF